jgi:hypothetical protein
VEGKRERRLRLRTGRLGDDRPFIRRRHSSPTTTIKQLTIGSSFDDKISIPYLPTSVLESYRISTPSQSLHSMKTSYLRTYHDSRTGNWRCTTINGLDCSAAAIMPVSSREIRYRRWELIKVPTWEREPIAASGHIRTGQV